MQQKPQLPALWLSFERIQTLPHHENITIEGRITDIFFHRFVVEMKSGKKVLADIGPKGADAFPLEMGMEIEAEGEMKPSELKVARIARKGDRAIVVERKKPEHHGPHSHHHEDADPEVARRAVEKAGFETLGVPRRKPKHFEVLARKERRLVECHVELDGHIRKEKPVALDDHKWSDELSAAA